jgi:site-specific recombinase XerD
MKDPHNAPSSAGEDRGRRIDQVHRAIQAQKGGIGSNDIREVLEELTDQQLDTLLKQIFTSAQEAGGASVASGQEPDKAELAASELHEQLVAYFRAGEGLPLPLFGGADLPLTLLVEPFLEARGFKAGTAASYRKAFERLVDVVGDSAPSALTIQDLERFVSALRTMRSNKGAREVLTPASVAKDIGHVRELFAAVAGSQPGRFNPAATLEVPKRAKVRAGASRITPFSEDQLARLGRAPIFRGCEDDRHITRPGDYLCRDGRFWFGVLKPFAGLGSSETTALLTTDIRLHHRVLHIDVNSDNGNGARNRMVPVHPTLIKLGFQEWVEKRRAAVGDGLLFEPRKYPRVWNDGVLDAAGLKAEGMTVEGMRVNFVEAVTSNAPERIALYLTGQLPSSADARVLDDTETTIALRIVSAIDFPGLG